MSAMLIINGVLCTPSETAELLDMVSAETELNGDAAEDEE